MGVVVVKEGLPAPLIAHALRKPQRLLPGEARVDPCAGKMRRQGARFPLETRERFGRRVGARAPVEALPSSLSPFPGPCPSTAYSRQLFLLRQKQSIFRHRCASPPALVCASQWNARSRHSSHYGPSVSSVQARNETADQLKNKHSTGGGSEDNPHPRDGRPNRRK